MEQRPVIQLPRSKAETVLDIICLLAILGIFVYMIYAWQDLPARIPMHFNGKGEINGWGSKWTLIIMPIIGMIIYSGLTFLSKVPHVFNYPIQITNENAHRQYQNSRLLINFLKTVMVVLFGFIEWSIIQSAKAGTDKLNFWIFGSILVILLGSIIFFLVRTYKLK